MLEVFKETNTIGGEERCTPLSERERERSCTYIYLLMEFDDMFGTMVENLI